MCWRRHIARRNRAMSTQYAAVCDSKMIPRARYRTDVKMSMIYHHSMLFICRGCLDAALGGLGGRRTGGVASSYCRGSRNSTLSPYPCIVDVWSWDWETSGLAAGKKIMENLENGSLDHDHFIWNTCRHDIYVHLPCSHLSRLLLLLPFVAVRWEFLVQRSVGLRLLCIEDVDLGSGPLEWLCKGLRSHQVQSCLVWKAKRRKTMPWWWIVGRFFLYVLLYGCLGVCQETRNPSRSENDPKIRPCQVSRRSKLCISLEFTWVHRGPRWCETYWRRTGHLSTSNWCLICRQSLLWVGGPKRPK